MTTTGTSRPDAGPKVLTESTITGYLGSPAFTEDPFPAYLFFLDHPRRSSAHDVRALFRLAPGHKGVTRDDNWPGL